MSGTLFIVATPIGNLNDLSRRALEILRSADVIVCENNRVSSVLLRAYEIQKPLVGLFEHASPERLANLVQQLLEGKNLAYISDAGTPGVSDPGGKLVAAALEQGIRVSPIPGPSAMAAAISVCGFPMQKFAFIGFAPKKKGRETFFKEIAARAEASIFYESKYRFNKTLGGLSKHLAPERLILVARELTKMHETLYRGTMVQVTEMMRQTSLKGEFVIIVAPTGFGSPESPVPSP